MKPSDPAEALLEAQRAAGTNNGWLSAELIWLFIAIFVIAAALFIWAAYIRKPRRERSSKDITPAPILGVPRRGRRGRRSRRTRRRNPTLAETGGLPPRKPDSQISDSQ